MTHGKVVNKDLGKFPPICPHCNVVGSYFSDCGIMWDTYEIIWTRYVCQFCGGHVRVLNMDDKLRLN